MRDRVIVVGAGIAGLAAAHRLQAAGIDVTVLEATARIGGRMTSDVVAGYVIDRGAQFLSSSYTTVMSLIREVGLAGDLRPCSPWAAIVREGRPRRVRAGRALSVWSNGLLRLPDCLKLGWFSLQMRRSLKLPFDDYAAWLEFDTEDAGQWCDRVLGADITDYIIEPSLQGYFFQEPAGNSKALVLMILGLYFKRGQVMTLAHGLGSLPERLAANLDVRCNTPVRCLSTDGPGVRVHTDTGEMEADWAILATTASAAEKLYAPANAIEQGLLGTPYSSTVNIGLATKQNWRNNDTLKHVYGLLVPRTDRDVIAAIGIESCKDPARVPDGELLDIMLADRAGRELVNRTDDEILTRVLAEAGRYFPGVAQSVRFAHIVRWNEAEPRSPVGRSRLISEYRVNWSPRQRVLLAGDYMGMPFTDGAAETGVWAASRICEREGNL